MDTLDLHAVGRMGLILMHLLAFAAAAAGNAFGDFAVFARTRVDAPLLRRAAQAVTLALAALWLSGLAIIAMDTGFVLEELWQRPKLMAKLTVATVLTLNGVALHRHAFGQLVRTHSNPLRAALLPSVLGAVSASSWLYAAFIGIAKPLAPALGYSGFMALYAAGVGVAVIVSLTLMRLPLARRLSSEGGQASTF